MSDYTEKLDSQVAYAGKYSLRIECKNRSQQHEYGFATTSFPVIQARGKNIHIGGYITTSNVTDGKGWLLITVYDHAHMLSKEYLPKMGVSGTHDWKYYDTDIQLDNRATFINITTELTGIGTVWFDHLDLSINNKPDTDNLFFIPRSIKDNHAPDSLTEEQASWLHSHIVPVTTTTPATTVTDNPIQAFKDLLPLQKFIGNAHLIGLGEGAHGTHEFSAMKHRMMEFLVRKMGFTIFALEADMPEADRINAYVLHGMGDPKQLIHDLNPSKDSSDITTTWDVDETLNMIEWMRAYNEAKGTSRPIQFVGIDMHHMHTAIDSIRAFLHNVDPDYAPIADSSYSHIEKYQIISRRIYSIKIWGDSVDKVMDSVRIADFPAMLQLAQGINMHLQKNRNEYIKKCAYKAVDRYIHYADIVCQALNLYHSNNQSEFQAYRDTCMAVNIEWLRAQYPASTKMIISAHDMHIAKRNRKMGGFLQQKYGNDYISVSFSFNAGSRNCYIYGNKRSVFGPTVDEPSFPGTLDWLFHSLGVPAFFLNLHAAAVEDTVSAWFTRVMPIHEAGRDEMSNEFRLSSISNDFDGIVYIDTISPSSILK